VITDLEIMRDFAVVVFYEVYYIQDDELYLQEKGLLRCKQTAVLLG